MAQHYDVIVLGAGIMGAATTYHLSKAGQRVLLLEQFELEHQKGSSHDASRIIRYSYDYPTYVEMAKANYPLWMALQEEAGETLYYRTGGVDFGTPDQPYIQDLIVALNTAGINYETLSPKEAEKRFPQFRFKDDMTVIYQADSGMLAATRSTLAHIRLAQQMGAAVLAETPATKIVPTHDGVEVHTEHEIYSAARLIVTAGGWIGELLEDTGLHLPITPTRVQLAYFQPDNPADYDAAHCPVFIAHVPGIYSEHLPYGLSSLNGSGLKIGLHGGEGVNHPSEINYTPDAEVVDRLRAFMRDHMPGANGKLLLQRVCVYTMTPDEHFIIDKHPEHPQIIICSACSGHGFKFGALIGTILKDLALEGTTSHDISLFNVTRFS